MERRTLCALTMGYGLIYTKRILSKSQAGLVDVLGKIGNLFFNAVIIQSGGKL